MTRKCERCSYDISITQILEQEKVSEIICPNCGRKLVATDLSKVVTLSFFLMVSVIFWILPLKIISKLCIQIVWAIISVYYLCFYIFIKKKKKRINKSSSNYMWYLFSKNFILWNVVSSV